MDRLEIADQVLAEVGDRAATRIVPGRVGSPMDLHNTVSVQRALIDDCERAAALGVRTLQSATVRMVEPYSA